MCRGRKYSVSRPGWTRVGRGNGSRKGGDLPETPVVPGSWRGPVDPGPKVLVIVSDDAVVNLPRHLRHSSVGPDDGGRVSRGRTGGVACPGLRSRSDPGAVRVSRDHTDSSGSSTHSVGLPPD